jgi:hypothetical protein
LFPAQAQHKPVTALAVTGIDFRLVDEAGRFFASQKLTNDYDQISLAGASLAAVSPRSPRPMPPSGTMSPSPSSCTLSAS